MSWVSFEFVRIAIARRRSVMMITPRKLCELGNQKSVGLRKKIPCNHRSAQYQQITCSSVYFSTNRKLKRYKKNGPIFRLVPVFPLFCFYYLSYLSQGGIINTDFETSLPTILQCQR